MTTQVGDRDNFSGDLTITAPTGGVTRGSVYQVASGVCYVARETVAAGLPVLVSFRGVVRVTRAASQTTVPGTKVYGDLTAHAASTTASGNQTLGYALETTGSSDTSVLIQLG